jgi:hypothetical protein
MIRVAAKNGEAAILIRSPPHTGAGLGVARDSGSLYQDFLGLDFLILAKHFLQDDGVPVTVPFFARHVIFPRPAAELELFY